MQRKVTPEKIKELMQRLAQAARSGGSVYFTGGATALLLGARDQTIDVDLKFDPEPAGVFEAIASLKNELNMNVELASPEDFIPVSPDWREKSIHIETIGKVSFFHYDLAAQALAKIERGYDQDLQDVKDFVRRKLVTGAELLKLFNEIKPLLIRYPAIDAGDFEHRLNLFVEELKEHA